MTRIARLTDPILISMVCLLMSGCASQMKQTDDIQVVIDQVEYVKLLPKRADSQGRFMVSTSCGQAEVKLKSGLLLTMRLGEWCETPHVSLPQDQVFVHDATGSLLEYYLIQSGHGPNADQQFIDLLHAQRPVQSVFYGLLKPLSPPQLMSSADPEEFRLYAKELDTGIVIQKDGHLYLNKVVFLEDIKASYHVP